MSTLGAYPRIPTDTPLHIIDSRSIRKLAKNCDVKCVRHTDGGIVWVIVYYQRRRGKMWGESFSQKPVNIIITHTYIIYTHVYVYIVNIVRGINDYDNNNNNNSSRSNDN